MDVNNFLTQLHSQAPGNKKASFVDFKSKRVLEKISLNFPGNFGRYALWPMNSPVIDYPFVKMAGTREICIPRKNVSPDGVENTFNAWIKLLPVECYKMKDASGRIMSSLTAEEEQLLLDAHSLYDQLATEIDAKNNMEVSRDLIRKRNYTIFNAYCLNKWDSGDIRTAKRSNFSGLFVCTASGFCQAVEDDINTKMAMNGGDSSFIDKIYGREATGRGGFIMFSISRSTSNPGYSVSITHEMQTINASIPEDDVELMQDPVEAFLGWQANRDEVNPVGERRLFNAKLIKSAIDFMTKQLGAIRMAKASGTSMADAIAATNAEVLRNSEPTNKQGQPTNDPMLAGMSSGQGMFGGMGNVAANNNAPFQTPPAAQINPVTGAPVNPSSGFGGFGGGQQQSPFSAPGFAQSGAGNSDLPF